MGSEFTGQMRGMDKTMQGKPAVQYGIDGKVKQADSTKVNGPKTSYIDRTSKETVKRTSQSSRPYQGD